MAGRILFAVAVSISCPGAPAAAAEGDAVRLENDRYTVTVARSNGTITSLVIKELGRDLVGEKRLAANFRIGLPLRDYQCHYIEGEGQRPQSVSATGSFIEVRFSGLFSSKGRFNIDLTYTITAVDDALHFKARLTNHTDRPVAEFWFPRLGGWTRFGKGRDALLATPNYIGCAHGVSLFRHFPGGQGLGAEAAEFSTNYPGMVMPWWDLYDAESDRGLYLGYHDKTFRFSTWHTYLCPTASGRPGDTWLTKEEAAGEPVGLVFSHVRYPYLRVGESLDSGEFILRVHRGDWHDGSRHYRKWFMANFPFDKAGSWLRKESSWFTSIIYQPEDRIVADYKMYDRWCKEAQGFGIHCFELIGWNKGGLERDYPEYVPEAKLGGRDGFRQLLGNIDARGGKCLVFVNYNVIDCNTEWYKRELHAYTHQDTFGNTPNWMAWGESTLTARLGLSTRRHLLSSVVPPFQRILEDQFLQLVRDGAHGFQIDKVCAGSALDFNPLNTEKPDVALCEGLIRAIGSLYEKCRQIRPDFRIASEAGHDRLIPYVDVFYRNSGGFDIAPLRYVFPEWTSCQHVSAPLDFNGVNSAVLTGSVICVEPRSYQASLADPIYKALALCTKEVERIRKDLAETIFLGDYHDTTGGCVMEVAQSPPSSAAKCQPMHSGAIRYRVHGHRASDRRALVVINSDSAERSYVWGFHKGHVRQAELHEPFQPVRVVSNDAPVSIKGMGLHILVERRDALPDKLKFMMRCGIAGGEVVCAADGYGARVVEGFRSAWGPCWVPPVYHCRASEDTVKIELRVPKGAGGLLRLYVIDPDRFMGGRSQEVKVAGASLGLVEGFEKGRWLEQKVASEVTKDGALTVQVINRKKGSNAVLSIIEWVET